MSLEIEHRYAINGQSLESIRARINSAYRYKGTYLFRTAQFENIAEKLTMRVRNEGTRVTFTIKNYRAAGAFAMEYETIVGDFDTMVKMLEIAGHKLSAFTEKIREIYSIDDEEVVIDHLPGLPAYIEIEAPNEARILQIASDLGCTVRITGKSARVLYNIAYAIPVQRPMSDLTFDTAPDVLGVYITKNRSAFNSTLAKQKALLATL